MLFVELICDRCRCTTTHKLKELFGESKDRIALKLFIERTLLHSFNCECTEYGRDPYCDRRDIDIIVREQKEIANYSKSVGYDR